MSLYYINPHDTDDQRPDNEVHEDGCYWLTLVQNPISLGDCDDCHEAVVKAKIRGYSRANGCIHCSEECNEG